ncbi:hypothetical protein GCM10009596_29840 [Arthrobacter rhombi]|uniref:8-oxoguanine DNA glycosylase OGG fold protein n=1 Tax=Arthrobacter rhombi TaxID=71253 RepID=UPI0031DF66B1
MSTREYRAPQELLEHLEKFDRAIVHNHEVPVNTAWWDGRLGSEAVAPGSARPQGAIRRSDLFELAHDDGHDDWAERLLWNALAWGTGTRSRNNGQRILSVQSSPDARQILQDAAAASRNDPDEAFGLFRSVRGRNTFAYLGPAFFTKFMYFAEAGRNGHSSAIVDQYVLDTLHSELGNSDFDLRFNFGRRVYRSALEAMGVWAADASEQVGRKIELDEIEYWAFTRGRERR